MKQAKKHRMLCRIMAGEADDVPVSKRNPRVNLNQQKPTKTDFDNDAGFSAFGKPVPLNRRQSAYEHCKLMGVTDNNEAWSCVASMASFIERDEPYKAMQAGMVFVDLTGTYRLMAVLCTDEDVTMVPKAKQTPVHLL